MKILSWNVRGLGGFAKRPEVRKLINEKNPSIVCIQETKLTVIDDVMCASLWGSSTQSYSFRPAVGAFGGLLIMWDSSVVEVWSSFSIQHALIIHGRFTDFNDEFYLFNIYAPCDNGAKQLLWNSLSEQLQKLVGKNICLCGDFNAVRGMEERKSRGVAIHSFDCDPFNSFIDNNVLVDLPLHGRNFTWYKGDGNSMSRIDRFLLSEEWCSRWPNCLQATCMRGLSDHCPLVLSVDDYNWGPKPVRMLKCWSEFPGYHQFVRSKLQSFQVDGWGGFVLKEKLKHIKIALKEWHLTHSHNLSGKILSLKNQIDVMEARGEVDELSVDEVADLHAMSVDLHSLSRANASISWQQSRTLWLREGDANSKYFHTIMSGRRRRNSLSTILVEGNVVEGVSEVRAAVFSYFQNHYQAHEINRPRVDDMNFRRLSVLEGNALTYPFNETEVKAAVWDCDGYKSPGPDGIPMGFIKDFWPELKGDIMRFVLEFHCNGRLSKGINSTFIALIPKIDNPHRLNDFRPIALVGCLYKILAKLLANRLRQVMGTVISDTRSTFIKKSANP